MIKHDQLRQLKNLRLMMSQEKSPLGIFISAGCPLSVCNDKGEPLEPDMRGLVALIENKHEGENADSDYNRLKVELSKAHVPATNLEMVLSFIRTLKAVAKGGQVRSFSEDQLLKLENEICDTIRKAVSKELPNKDTSYGKLARWINSIYRQVPVEIFTTNYDLLIEQALEEEKIPYFDGFSGSRYPFFDALTMGSNDFPKGWCSLWKLHGSINWKMINNEVCRVSKDIDGSAELIYPSRLKYDQSRKMPFLAMADRLHDFILRPSSFLVICGYSFNDEHINDLINSALQSNPTANVLALMYGRFLNENKKSQYPLAEDLALQRANLSLWYDDEAIIGTQKKPWNDFRDEKKEFLGFDFKLKENVVSLGDFLDFTIFLESIIGNDENE